MGSSRRLSEPSTRLACASASSGGPSSGIARISWSGATARSPRAVVSFVRGHGGIRLIHSFGVFGSSGVIACRLLRRHGIDVVPVLSSYDTATREVTAKLHGLGRARADPAAAPQGGARLGPRGPRPLRIGGVPRVATRARELRLGAKFAHGHLRYRRQDPEAAVYLGRGLSPTRGHPRRASGRACEGRLHDRGRLAA